MKIIVLIKQVPFVDQLKFDPGTRRIVRENVESEVNPFDKRALTKAIELKKEFGAEVVAVTMGPPQAKQALAEALAMGADRAVHLLGREFAGADSLATARALALAAERIGYDLIVAGKYSTDAETAQVPGMLAELLHVPQITGATALKLDKDGKQLTATRELDQGFETVTCALPAVISAAERLVKPLKVAPAQLEAARTEPVEVLSPTDLSPDTSIFGLSGSPTFVSDIYSIEPTRKHIIRQLGSDPSNAVLATVSDLVQEGLFGEWKSRSAQIITPKPRVTASPHRAIWVLAELDRGEIRPVTLELLGRSVQLANDFDGEVGALLIGSSDRRHIATLAAFGADRVLVAATAPGGTGTGLAGAEGPPAEVDGTSLEDYDTELYTDIVAKAIREYDPFAVLVPSTAQGRDLAPRVAARLGVGLTGDCIGLELDAEGRLVQLKPAFGGNIVAPILTRTRPAMATVRPGIFQTAANDPSHRAQIGTLEVEPGARGRVTRTGFEPSPASGIELDNAEIIIGVGMGIGSAENLRHVRKLARVLDAPIGATRKAVDAAWLPRQVQIGLTGRSIAPRLYISIGTSGKFNHTVGIQRSGIILAINNQPDADIFRQADYGLVGDWEQAVTALTRYLSERKTQSGGR